MLTTTPLPDPVIDAARTIAVPRAAPADSFVLHAPLELIARVGLLPYVDPSARAAAIAGIRALAAEYTATGPPVTEPVLDDENGHHHEAGLAAAIDDSDLDRVDAHMARLTAATTPHPLRARLGELVVDSLAAAAHTPIGLYLLPIVADGRLPASLLRGPVRELARHPDWRLRWFREPPADGPTAEPAPEPAPSGLDAALHAVPHLGRPGSDFIFPIMSQAEGSGVAPGLLRNVHDTDVDSARRTLLRAAAWSMLHDDPEQAPYGWTHCLTMPQAVLALAGEAVTPRTAVAVAATYVVGFRAAHGVAALGSLDDDNAIAGDAQDTDVTELATYAALHHDAHLVKYTLSCLLAASDDPAWASTYIAAARFLGNWWREHELRTPTPGMQ